MLIESHILVIWREQINSFTRWRDISQPKYYTNQSN